MTSLEDLADELQSIYQENQENLDNAHLEDSNFQITETHRELGKKLQHLREEDSYSVTQRKALFLGQMLMVESLVQEGGE